jgi:hypothetical protein
MRGDAGVEELLDAGHGANVAVPVLVADDETERGAVEVSATHGFANVLSERRVGQVELEAEATVFIVEPERPALRPAEDFVRIVVEKRTHVALEDAGEGSRCDLLPVAAEILGEDVVDGREAVDGAPSGVEALHVNVDRALFWCRRPLNGGAHASTPSPFVDGTAICTCSDSGARFSRRRTSSRFIQPLTGSSARE